MKIVSRKLNTNQFQSNQSLQIDKTFTLSKFIFILGTITDRQCAEVNRQKIEGESPLSGKAQQAARTPSHGRLSVMTMVKR
jgi:hypothetical protein